MTVLRRLGVFRAEPGVVVCYFLLACYFTYPLVFNIQGGVFGDPGDPQASVWWFWWYKYAWLNNLDWQKVPLVGYPLGIDSTNDPLPYLLIYYSRALSLLIGEVATYNLIAFLGYPLSALSMYLLVRYLTKSKMAGFLAGLIYGFAPYHTAQAYAHLTLASMQWLPLYLVCLFRLREKVTYARAALCGLAFAILLLDNYYYGYFMAIVTVIFLVVSFLWWYSRRDRSSFDSGVIRKGTFSGLVSLAAILPFTYQIILQAITRPRTGSLSTDYVRPLSDLFDYSSRFWEFLLPSYTHPLFGQYVLPFYISHRLGNLTEQVLYLGFVPIVLAAVALVSRRNTVWSDNEGFIKVFLLVTIAVALLFSGPPEVRVFGMDVPMPSYFAYRFFPFFRVYARFTAIIVLALSVLAGFGIARILPKIAGVRKRLVLLGLISSLVIVEFVDVPPFRFMDLSTPPGEYTWLAKQPGDFVVAEYPLVASDERFDSEYRLYQRLHGKTLVNGAQLGTKAEETRRLLKDIADLNVVKELATIGVKYVIIHTDKYQRGSQYSYPPGQAPDLSRSELLRLVASFDKGKVYEIIK